MLLGRHLKLVKGITPKCFHIVPVGDDTVGDGIVELKHSSILLGALAHEKLLVVLGDHHLGMHRATNTKKKTK